MRGWFQAMQLGTIPFPIQVLAIDRSRLSVPAFPNGHDDTDDDEYGSTYERQNPRNRVQADI